MKPGSHHTPEARALIGAASRGHKTSDEQKAKLSAIMRQRLADPDIRARHGQAARLARLTTEQRADYFALRHKLGMSRAEALAALGVAP